MAGLSRRSFIGVGAAFAAAVPEGARGAEAEAAARNPFLGTGGAPFRAGEPCLQAPGETTMGVSWAVSGLAKGVVEFADNPEFRNSKTVKSGGYGLVPIDTAALGVRLEGLRPATRYWYRTVTTPFTDYSNIYDAKMGEAVVGKVHSFKTLGAAAEGHVAMFCDTHAKASVCQMVAAKVKELRPSVAVWNGDATNTTQDKATAVKIFLDQPIDDADYSAEIPVCFESGNHDFRGSWISRKEEVVMPRHPAERDSSEWDLKWNFAVRVGDIALVGMDTGEDKPDAHPKWFGLANFEPYRRAQTAWLEKALSRPDIAAAKFKVVCCHIPLQPIDSENDDDGSTITPHGYARWQGECYRMWNPILERHGVQLVLAGHRHRYHYNAPDANHSWHQVIGGGCDFGPGLFPTVVDCKVEDGRLHVVTYDVSKNAVVGDFTIA